MALDAEALAADIALVAHNLAATAQVLEDLLSLAPSGLVSDTAHFLARAA